MVDTEIIDQAIKKAQANGWDEFHSQYARVYKQDGEIMVEFLVGIDAPPLLVSLERVLFSESFAESFFGMETYYLGMYDEQSTLTDGQTLGWKSETELKEASVIPEGYYNDMPACEYHLQQLATTGKQSERVAYIEKYL
jgi:hypothetical protein